MDQNEIEPGTTLQAMIEVRAHMLAIWQELIELLRIPALVEKLNNLLTRKDRRH